MSMSDTEPWYVKNGMCKFCGQHQEKDDYCKCPKGQDHDIENECKFCGRCNY